MRRRALIATLGAAVAWPLAARGQPSATPVVGYLGSASAEPFARFTAAFLQSLAEAGYVEGQNLAMEYRWAEGHYDRLPALATELAARQVAVIVATGGNAPAQAAKAATEIIPVVFISGGEPVRAGLVASLSRPGGNVTGVSFIAAELVAKRLELLRELAPKAAAIGALVNPDYPDADLQLRELRDAGEAIKQPIHIVTAGTERDIDAAFATFIQQGTDALLVANDPFFVSRREQIVALAGRNTIPTVYSWREAVAAGGLMSYGASLLDAYRQAGLYVAKMLKGANPADLPVIQPTTFELVINLKTAKALGLDMPRDLLLRADEVIE